MHFLGNENVNAHFLSGLHEEKDIATMTSLITDLNLLYFAACSLEPANVEKVTRLLSVCSLLESEVNKLYPRVNLASILIMRTKEIDRTHKLLQSRLKILELIFCSRFESKLLLNTHNGQNVFGYLFELRWDKRTFDLIKLIFSDEQRANVFVFDHIGVKETDDVTIGQQKYAKWLDSKDDLKGLLFNICEIDHFEVDYFQWAMTFLGSYNNLTSVEMRLLFRGRTIMIGVVESLLMRYSPLSKTYYIPWKYTDERDRK